MLDHHFSNRHHMTIQWSLSLLPLPLPSPGPPSMVLTSCPDDNSHILIKPSRPLEAMTKAVE